MNAKMAISCNYFDFNVYKNKEKSSCHWIDQIQVDLWIQHSTIRNSTISKLTENIYRVFQKRTSKWKDAIEEAISNQNNLICYYPIAD